MADQEEMHIFNSTVPLSLLRKFWCMKKSHLELPLLPEAERIMENFSPVRFLHRSVLQSTYCLSKKRGSLLFIAEYKENETDCSSLGSGFLFTTVSVFASWRRLRSSEAAAAAIASEARGGRSRESQPRMTDTQSRASERGNVRGVHVQG